MKIDYICRSCGDKTDNLVMDSFVCKCGGDYRIDSYIDSTTFKPYFSRELGNVEVKSPSQEKKLWKQHGVVPLADCRDMVRRASKIRRNKEDFIKSVYAKDGLNYKLGSNTRYDETTHSFIPR